MEAAAQNLGGWAAQLRDEAMAIISSEDVDPAKPHVQKIADLATLFADGQDTNGNDIIEPIPNEGGAQTVFYYAQRMADMPVLAGSNRVPDPASGNPTPNTAPEPGSSSNTGDEGYIEGR